MGARDLEELSTLYYTQGTYWEIEPQVSVRAT